MKFKVGLAFLFSSMFTFQCFASEGGLGLPYAPGGFNDEPAPEDVQARYKFNKAMLNRKIRLGELNKERERLIRDQADWQAKLARPGANQEQLREDLQEITELFIQNFKDTRELISEAMAALKQNAATFLEGSQAVADIYAKADAWREKTYPLAEQALMFIPGDMQWGAKDLDDLRGTILEFLITKAHQFMAASAGLFAEDGLVGSIREAYTKFLHKKEQEQKEKEEKYQTAYAAGVPIHEVYGGVPVSGDVVPNELMQREPAAVAPTPEEIKAKAAFDKVIAQIQNRLEQLKTEREHLIAHKSEKNGELLVNSFNESFQLFDAVEKAISGRLFDVDEESQEFKSLHGMGGAFDQVKSALANSAYDHLPQEIEWGALGPATQSALSIKMSDHLSGEFLETFKWPEKHEKLADVRKRFKEALILQKNKVEGKRKAQELEAQKAQLSEEELLAAEKEFDGQLASINRRQEEINSELSELLKYRGGVLKGFYSAKTQSERQLIVDSWRAISNDELAFIKENIALLKLQKDLCQKRIEFITGTPDAGKIPLLEARIKACLIAIDFSEKALDQQTKSMRKNVKLLQREVDEMLENPYEED